MTHWRVRLEWGSTKFRRAVRAIRKRSGRVGDAPHGHAPPSVLLILGCQRSGTTLLSNLFDQDRRTLTFLEESELTTANGGAPLRSNALDEVDRYLSGLGVPLAVLKPLVESQRAPELLEGLTNSRAVWMYRHYRDVAASSVRTFGEDTAIRDIELLLTNDPPNWRGEFVPHQTRQAVEELFAPQMRSVDAAALFWWSRNMLFFQKDLAARQDVCLVSYEELVDRTVDVMRDLYKFTRVPFEEQSLSRSVHRRALDRGHDVELSPPVEELCRGLYERLDGNLPQAGRPASREE